MTQETDTKDQIGRARELIAETERVRQWLDRLDAEGSDRPAHIVERVRSDYASRLERLTGELGSHRATVEESLREARNRLEERESAVGELRDHFEELRLRHEIGEIDDGEWETQRPRAESEAGAAERARDEERQRVDGLEAILSELDPGDEDPIGEQEEAIEVHGPPSEDESAPRAESTGPEPEPASDEEDAEASVEAALDRWESPPTAETDGADPEESADDDLAFLEGLDRAIASGGDEAPPTPAPPGAAAAGASETAEQRLPCKECGAINDPRAWYCEVCGMELS